MLEDIRLGKEGIKAVLVRFGYPPEVHYYQEAIANTATDKAIKKVLELLEEALNTGNEIDWVKLARIKDAIEALKNMIKE